MMLGYERTDDMAARALLNFWWKNHKAGQGFFYKLIFGAQLQIRCTYSYNSFFLTEVIFLSTPFNICLFSFKAPNKSNETKLER